jgi:molecular chaperone DnaK
LTPDEIERMKKEAEANADSDRIARERAEKLNEADSMIFQTENQLKELGEKMPAEHKASIEAALEELKTAHQSQDLAAIQNALDKINAAWKTASENMYAQGAEGGEPQAAQPQAENQGDQVQDVDYEEVK